MLLTRSVFSLHVFFLCVCFSLATVSVKAWLTGPLFDCLRGGIREHSVRGQTRILSLEPAVSHEPSHRKRDHVRLGDAHSERITSLLSLGSPSLQLTLRTKQYVKHHIFPTCICGGNRSREQKKNRKKKKSKWEMFTEAKTLPRLF